ncbi:hypothetical protein [Tahibacter harae]|uniref:Uncharacterized protein n=1 Tax=Tahibacter harae TaxID=2963937 RepID=A0ABT1QYL4_9GAMM|nr:hypothetical protein [Tahibacter harae]MCQ4167345.1 hypothetical protein [Tahibacter harae]
MTGDGWLTQVFAVCGWVWLILAVAVQLLNLLYLVHNALGKGNPLQIHAVPVMLWALALLCRREGFFIASPLAELGVVAAVHVAFDIVAARVERRARRKVRR